RRGDRQQHHHADEHGDHRDPALALASDSRDVPHGSRFLGFPMLETTIVASSSGCVPPTVSIVAVTSTAFTSHHSAVVTGRSTMSQVGQLRSRTYENCRSLMPAANAWGSPRLIVRT